MLELRDYQIDVINQTINSNKATLIQLPTGSGKTLVAKHLALDFVSKQNKQVLFVAPKIVLMNQTAEVFKSLNPHIVHGSNEYTNTHPVLISTLQTASRKTDLNPDIIIMDEIHFGFDGKMIENLIKDKPNVRIIGLSATPYDKSGKLLHGFGLIIDKYDLKYMVEQKYLVEAKVFVLTRVKGLDSVQVIGGDYNQKELSKVVSNNQTIMEIIQSTSEYIDKHNKVIVFAVDINHAELLAKAYVKEGYVARALHSKQSRDEQDFEIKQFKQGNTKILVSVLMLTTGFDVPDTDLAILARPTRSQNLYKQMVGRVLRLAEGKTEAVLLDCANVVENLGMPLDPIKEIEASENTSKYVCRECKSENIKLKKDGKDSHWICLDCGYKKEVEQGAYQCKMCNTVYTHDAKFEQKDNKLFLVCDKCPYPTLISEYTGEEQFVEIVDKNAHKASKYLSYDEAHEYVLKLNFKSRKEWKEFIKDIEVGKVSLPKNIPILPHSAYQNSGWINLDVWLGVNEDMNLSFKKARSFIHSLNFDSHEEWFQYRKNELHSSDNKIPKMPQKKYQGKGWVSLDDWIGLDLKKEKKFKLLEEFADQSNIDSVVDTIGLYKNLYWMESISHIANLVDNKSLHIVLNELNYLQLIDLMNFSIKENKYLLFKEISNIEQRVTEEKTILIHCDDKALQNLILNYGDEDSLAIIKIILSKVSHMKVILRSAAMVKNDKILDLVINVGVDLEDIVYSHTFSDTSTLEAVLKRNSNYDNFDISQSIDVNAIEDTEYYEDDLKWYMSVLTEKYEELLELIRLLNEFNINIIINQEKRTMLGLANLIKSDFVDFFDVLMNNSLSLDYTIFGQSLCSHALNEGSSQICMYLLEKKLLPITVSNFYISIIFGLENKLNTEIIKKLHKPEYNLNELIKEKSLLHYAIDFDSVDIVEFLLSNGADAQIHDDQGRTPIALAKESGKDEFISILENHNKGSLHV